MTGQTTTSAAGHPTFLDVRRSESERLITISEYRGRTFVHLRVWYSTESGEFKPGRAGVTLRPEQIPEVCQSLVLAARAIDSKGAN